MRWYGAYAVNLRKVAAKVDQEKTVSLTWSCFIGRFMMEFNKCDYRYIAKAFTELSLSSHISYRHEVWRIGEIKLNIEISIKASNTLLSLCYTLISASFPKNMILYRTNLFSCTIGNKERIYQRLWICVSIMVINYKEYFVSIIWVVLKLCNSLSFRIKSYTFIFLLHTFVVIQ